MKNRIVLDCSLFISSIMHDEEENLDSLINYKIFVPSLFYIECTNVIKSAISRKRITHAVAELYIEILTNLEIHVDTFSSTSEAVRVLKDISFKHNLTTYDSSYLELAKRLNISIGSKDNCLIEACKKEKIKVLKY